MNGNLVTVLPMGSFVGLQTIDGTTPPIDVRGYPKGVFTLQVDGFMGVAMSTTLQVTIETSNDGINWIQCANQFSVGPITLPGPGFKQTLTAFVDDLAAAIRLKISGNDPAGGFLGFRIGVQACLKSA